MLSIVLCLLSGIKWPPKSTEMQKKKKKTNLANAHNADGGGEGIRELMASDDDDDDESYRMIQSLDLLLHIHQRRPSARGGPLSVRTCWREHC